MIIGQINDLFGSKRGLFNSAKFRILYILGKYNKYREVDFKKIHRLVFVCTGNICRSPLAEHYACSLGFPSDSFGMRCRGGDCADPRAIKFASTQKIEMTHHVTKNIRDFNHKDGDLIIAMQPNQITELEKLGYSNVQFTLLPIWAISNVYLHDPYNSTIKFFNRCERIVLAAVDGLMDKLKAN